MTFEMDTSGVVGAVDESDPILSVQTGYTWLDLDAFTQGYVEAMFASLPVKRCGWCGVPVKAAARKDGFGCGRHAQCTETVRDERARLYVKGFSDLAPETLARIIADCAAWRETDRGVYSDDNGLSGRALWAMRQSPMGVPGFPPLTVQLGDDGKVRFVD